MKRKLAFTLALIIAFLTFSGFAYKEDDVRFISAPVAAGNLILQTNTQVLRVAENTIYYKGGVYTVPDEYLKTWNEQYPNMLATGDIRGTILMKDNNSDIVFIGDSRMVFMYYHGIDKEAPQERQDLTNSISWIAQSGEGLDWFNEYAFPALYNDASYVGKTIVISLGTNDLTGNYNAMIRRYKQTLINLTVLMPGCNICVTTINPGEGPKGKGYNYRIERFNQMLRTQLPPGIHVIDGYALCDTYIPRTYLPNDGVHFDSVFNYAMENFYYSEAKRISDESKAAAAAPGAF